MPDTGRHIEGDPEVVRLLRALHKRVDELEDGNGQPGLKDVVRRVFGDARVQEKGLVTQHEELAKAFGALDRKVSTIFDRVFYLLLGVGLNLIAQLPDILGFVGGIFGAGGAGAP